MTSPDPPGLTRLARPGMSDDVPMESQSSAYLPGPAPAGRAVPVELAWFGVSTFRLRAGESVIFLDAYLDRVPGAAPTGLTAAQVTAADYVLIGHSHFDHLHGAQDIARATGATVVGSYETIRLLADAGIPGEQLIAASGGELVDLGPDLRARVLPSLHSCIWARGTAPGQPAERGLSHQEHLRRLGAGLAQRDGRLPEEVRAHLRSCLSSRRGDGGALGYLLDTPAGTIYWADTSGYWTGVVRGMRPDLAVIAAAGTGNVDGEPARGTLADFVAGEVSLLQPRHLVLCHHDNWMPPVTAPPDLEPVRAALASQVPGTRLHEPGYDDALPLNALLAT
jgi:L-ascorbate metabolism protein UlaG (beta-lactamase superfamily)